MRNTKSETQTTSVKESSITDEVKQEIFDAVQFDGGALHEAFARTFGIKAWFNAYIKSKEFFDLEEENKEAAFNAFLELTHFLDEIDAIHSKHGLSVYRQE
jgi:hypothetical protein